MENKGAKYEDFLTLARDLGIDTHNEAHLKLLYPEVIIMLERMEEISNVATDDIHLGSNVDLVIQKLEEGI